MKQYGVQYTPSPGADAEIIPTESLRRAYDVKDEITHVYIGYGEVFVVESQWVRHGSKPESKPTDKSSWSYRYGDTEARF